MRSDIITSLEAITADGNVQASHAKRQPPGSAIPDGQQRWTLSCSATARPPPSSGVMATALLTISAATGKMTAARPSRRQAHRPHRLPAHPEPISERRRRMARHVLPRCRSVT